MCHCWNTRSVRLIYYSPARCQSVIFIKTFPSLSNRTVKYRWLNYWRMYTKKNFFKPLQIPPPEMSVVNSCVSAFQWLHNSPFDVCAVLSVNQFPTDGTAVCKVFGVLCLCPFSLVVFPHKMPQNCSCQIFYTLLHFFKNFLTLYQVTFPSLSHEPADFH